MTAFLYNILKHLQVLVRLIQRGEVRVIDELTHGLAVWRYDHILSYWFRINTAGLIMRRESRGHTLLLRGCHLFKNLVRILQIPWVAAETSYLITWVVLNLVVTLVIDQVFLFGTNSTPTMTVFSRLIAIMQLHLFHILKIKILYLFTVLGDLSVIQVIVLLICRHIHTSPRIYQYFASMNAIWQLCRRLQPSYIGLVLRLLQVAILESQILQASETACRHQIGVRVVLHTRHLLQTILISFEILKELLICDLRAIYLFNGNWCLYLLILRVWVGANTSLLTHRSLHRLLIAHSLKPARPHSYHLNLLRSDIPGALSKHLRSRVQRLCLQKHVFIVWIRLDHLVHLVEGFLDVLQRILWFFIISLQAYLRHTNHRARGTLRTAQIIQNLRSNLMAFVVIKCAASRHCGWGWRLRVQQIMNIGGPLLQLGLVIRKGEWHCGPGVALMVVRVLLLIRIFLLANWCLEVCISTSGTASSQWFSLSGVSIDCGKLFYSLLLLHSNDVYATIVYVCLDFIWEE